MGLLGSCDQKRETGFAPYMTYRSISATSNLQMASTKTTFHCSGVIIWFLFERTKISKGFTLTIGVTIKSTKIYTKIIYQSFYIQIMSLLPVSPGSSSYLLHQVCEPLRLESMPWNWLLIKVFQRDQLPNREARNPWGKNGKQFCRKIMESHAGQLSVQHVQLGFVASTSSTIDDSCEIDGTFSTILSAPNCAENSRQLCEMNLEVRMNLKCVICSSYVQDCQIVRCLLSFDYMTRGGKSPTLPPTIIEVEILKKANSFRSIPFSTFHFFQMDFSGKKNANY